MMNVKIYMNARRIYEYEKFELERIESHLRC